MPNNSETKKSEIIEIPVGKYIDKARANPWVLSTIVLAFVVLVLLFFNSGASISGESVSESKAAQNLLDFINEQGQGTAEVVSTEKSGSLYLIIVNFNGQEIPVYVTLDGEFLITDPVPLSGASGTVNTGTGANTGEKVQVDIEGSPSLGSKAAPVVIVEFSDYECPFCGKFYGDALVQLKKNYIDTGKVLLVYKDFPLSFHPNAQKAAESARCAGEQGKYWNMHDKLFENQQSLSVENYKKWARELGLNGAAFDSCLDSGKYSKAVQDDETYGAGLGVTGTPGFFINGLRVEGAQPYSVFQQIIDSELN